MIKIIIFVLVFIYLLILQRVAKVWLQLFQQDRSISPEDKRLSWLILIMGAIFWTLVVPISYLTLLEAKLAGQKSNLDDAEVKEINYYSSKTLPIVLDSVKC